MTESAGGGVGAPAPPDRIRRSQLVYRVTRPPGEAAGAPLVVLHGRDGGLDDLVPLGRAVAGARTIVAPEAARGVYNGAALVGHTWFGIQGPGRAEPASFGDSLFQLEQFVYDLVDDYGPGRLPLLLGYDLGGALALAAAVVIPDFLSGVAAVAAAMPQVAGWEADEVFRDGLPVLLVYDPADEDTSPDLVRRTTERLAAAGAAVEPARVERARELGLEVEQVLARWLQSAP